ncbi:hypothetical protein SCLCIDRAFT_264840 [Scleroderma citrinum Foug A]|uniref:Uncharacterized protein n=1 Tax=Scleroderma citrinum Foug A TaxID=1036808 RepID=A0A0C3D5I3_9AGAM|nr:hypothetical protein SCLCIDRAFT_264840 [Scleroderma citrinum Foug A]
MRSSQQLVEITHPSTQLSLKVAHDSQADLLTESQDVQATYFQGRRDAPAGCFVASIRSAIGQLGGCMGGTHFGMMQSWTSSSREAPKSPTSVSQTD